MVQRATELHEEAIGETAQTLSLDEIEEIAGELGVPAEYLRAAAGTELSAYKLPEAIRVVGELPLTAAGKLDRSTLRLEMVDGNDVDTR